MFAIFVTLNIYTSCWSTFLFSAEFLFKCAQKAEEHSESWRYQTFDHEVAITACQCKPGRTVRCAVTSTSSTGMCNHSKKETVDGNYFLCSCYYSVTVKSGIHVITGINITRKLTKKDIYIKLWSQLLDICSILLHVIVLFIIIFYTLLLLLLF